MYIFTTIRFTMVKHIEANFKNSQIVGAIGQQRKILLRQSCWKLLRCYLSSIQPFPTSSRREPINWMFSAK